MAVSDLSFSVQRGAILGLVGPNGAGKTTTFNVITGALVPTSGMSSLIMWISPETCPMNLVILGW